MSKRILLSVLLAACSGSVLAASNDSTERRVDTETYQMQSPTTPVNGGIVEAQAATERSVASDVSGPLAELRARHQSEYATLLQSLANARDNAERASLEQRAGELKLRQAREELVWLKAAAIEKGDAAYAARLDEALRETEPKAAPVATTFVPRDTVTGAALNAAEGSAK
jgi:hypothetical protein